MTLTKMEARRIIEIATEDLQSGAEPKECFRRVRDEIPHATVDDIKAAFDARLFELEEDAAAYKAEVKALERICGFMDKAVEITGNKQITVEEAATLMAARGDADAIEFLRCMDDPEQRLTAVEFDAAIAAHPGWWVSPDQMVHTKPDCPEDTPEKLLAWHRRRKATTA